MIKLVVFVILRLILFVTFIICGKNASEKTIAGQYKRNYWKCSLPAIVVYTLVEGLRYGRGVDFPNYLLAYHNIELYNTERWGFAFKMLYKLMHLIDIPEPMIFCVFSLITIVVFLFFMQNFREFSTFLFPLFLLATIGLSENLIRQYISIAFTMLAILYCIRKDLVRLVLSFILAFMFHKASLFMAPFLLIAYIWPQKKHRVVKNSRNNYLLFVLLTIYILPLFVSVDFLNDSVLGYFFTRDILEDYESYSNASVFERDMLAFSLITQIKEWLMWGFLLILGYNIKDKYTSIGLSYIYYCFFVGSVILHINTGSSLFRLNLCYTTIWYVIAAAVIYDFFKNRRDYSILSQILFYGFVIMILQSYLPVMFVPTVLGCDFIWDAPNY